MNVRDHSLSNEDLKRQIWGQPTEFSEDSLRIMYQPKYELGGLKIIIVSLPNR